MLTTGAANLTHLLIFVVYKSLLTASGAGAHTLRKFYRILAWSLNACYTGEWPSEDHLKQPYTSGPDFERAGKKLPGGYFLVLWKSKQVDMF